MESKEKIRDLNQIFTTMFNRIPIFSRSTSEVLIKYYNPSLLLTVAMFVNRIGTIKLRETFDEAVKVEKGMVSLKGNPSVEESKMALSAKKVVNQSMLKTKVRRRIL